MFIRILSDIHLEFGDFMIPRMDHDDETILILAGDVLVGTNQHSAFIEAACMQFQNVIYVLGNHEFYNNEVLFVKSYWQKRSWEISNLHVLDDDAVVIDDVRFIGGTMWTNFHDGDFFAIQEASKNMNDFFCVSIEDEDCDYGFNRHFLPADAMRSHLHTVSFFKDHLYSEFDGKTVVVSHHLPLGACVAEQYRGDILSEAYYSNLEYVFRDFDFDLWVHGHTHESVDLDDVYGKRVIANPRGYFGKEVNPNFDAELIVEL